MSVTGYRRRGFTLTEVLVALAIMVVLFALLFAPMVAGLEWVTSGRANVGMQDACRLAMEQIRRELGEAVYVFPAGDYLGQGPWADFRGPDNTWYTQDDTRVVNYSQVVFNPPARDSFGKVIYPPRAATRMVDTDNDGLGDRVMNLVVRFAIQLADATQPYDDFNPFVLYREEYLWNPDEATPLGSGYDSALVWDTQPLVRNAMTPKRGATFVPASTAILDDASGNPLNAPQYVRGYLPASTSDTRRRIFMFNGLRFEPQRIVGEQLDTENGIIYKSRYGGWDGTRLGYYRDASNNAYDFLPPYLAGQDVNFRLARSELDPRIALYRWDGASYAPLAPGMDSAVPTGAAATASAVRGVHLRWSPDGGTVTCGQQARSGATDFYAAMSFSAPAAPGGWYNVVTPSGVTYVRSSTLAVPPDSADAPITYQINPDDGYGPAVIDADSVKVKVVTLVGGTLREIELKPTANFEQPTIRGDEFCALLNRHDSDGNGVPDGTALTLRFSRFDPPRPTSQALFGNSPADPNQFEIRVYYYYRRNFAYDAVRDAAGQDPFVNDVVKVDYSTRAIQNVSLTLEAYVELEQNAWGGWEVPADEHPNEVSMREQIVARNYGR